MRRHLFASSLSLALVVALAAPCSAAPASPSAEAKADKPLLDIHANLFVERDSQKGIVIGHKGSRLREVGTQARKGIEAMLGTPVYLDLHVKVAKDWQRDPKQLRRLGF